ncbi:MAG: TRAP transporter large permease subunit, partial [Pseudomonadota bacterium]
MTEPQIAIMMLVLFIISIFLGFPVAFTLMAMAVLFGYYAYFEPDRMWRGYDRAVQKSENATPEQIAAGDVPGSLELTFEYIGGFLNNRVFDLFVNQTYSVMSNDVLTAIPLFLFMGYVVERANIVTRLFDTLYVTAKRLPGAMAVAALATCALFATATGIIGAVVTLMGMLALPSMLRAKYDVSFASGVICAGGCLGILIPPSIMLIVYAATSNVSIVKLYAGALFPGFLLAGLYMIYVVGRATLQPQLAPKPPREDTDDLSFGTVILMLVTSFFPLAILIFAVLGAILFGLATPSEAASLGALGGLLLALAYRSLT